MGWRMKKFYIFGVHGKIRVLSGVMKNQYIGGITLKGGLAQFADLRRWGIGKNKRGYLFDGGFDTPMQTMYFSEHVCVATSK